MNSRPGLTALLTVLTAHALADALPEPGQTDARIRTAVYRADEVYRLHGRAGYQIDLEFASEERFVGLAAGDVQALSFEAQDNHLFLKPKAARVATNVTVLTTLRHYQLDYRVEPRRPNDTANADAIYALRFSYPDDQAAAEQAATRAADARQREEDLSEKLAAYGAPLNYHYAYCGARAIRPTAVTDDGVQTRFSFGARTELPAVFTQAEDGSESLVNYTVTGDGLTVHRIAPRYILRRGKLVGCVVNQAFDGAGTRLESGTRAPTVERTVPAAPDRLQPTSPVRR